MSIVELCFPALCFNRKSQELGFQSPALRPIVVYLFNKTGSETKGSIDPRQHGIPTWDMLCDIRNSEKAKRAKFAHVTDALQKFLQECDIGRKFLPKVCKMEGCQYFMMCFGSNIPNPANLEQDYPTDDDATRKN